MTCSVDTNPNLPTSVYDFNFDIEDDYKTNSVIQHTSLQKPDVETQDAFVY